MDNYYEILGVANTATPEAIRDAIRTTRKRYRQVAGSPNKEQARNAEVMMEKLAAAETELLDEGRRRAYDAALASAPISVPEQPQAAGPSTNWIDTAKDYLANGNPRNAAQAAKQATTVNSESVEAWIVRAYAGLELRDYADADFSASEAQRRDPNDPQILGLLGDVYDAEGRFGQAQQAFAQAAQLEPTNPYWYGRVAWAMSDQEDVKGALAYAEQITTSFPGDEYATSVKAHMLLRDAEASLSQEDDSVYFTSKKQLAYVQNRLNEVSQLGSTQEGVTSYYNQMNSLLEGAKKRKFYKITYRRIIILVLLVILCFVMFASGQFGVIFVALVITGLFVWWTVERCWPPQWKINKKAMGAGAKPGLQ